MLVNPGPSCMGTGRFVWRCQAPLVLPPDLVEDGAGQGYEDEEVGDFGDGDGGPIEPLALFAHGDVATIDAELFDLVPGKGLFAIADALLAHAEGTKIEDLARVIGGQGAWQQKVGDGPAQGIAELLHLFEFVIKDDFLTIQALNRVFMRRTRIDAVAVVPGDLLPHALDLVPAIHVRLVTLHQQEALVAEVDTPGHMDQEIYNIVNQEHQTKQREEGENHAAAAAIATYEDNGTKDTGHDKPCDNSSEVVAV